MTVLLVLAFLIVATAAGAAGFWLGIRLAANRIPDVMPRLLAGMTPAQLTETAATVSQLRAQT